MNDDAEEVQLGLVPIMPQVKSLNVEQWTGVRVRAY